MPTQTQSIWTPELRRVYQKFPGSIRSKDWDEIVKKSNSGDVEGALNLASQHQKSSKKIKAENITARRLRIERVSLFTRLATAEREGRVLFLKSSLKLERRLARLKQTAAGISSGSNIIHEEMIELRKNLRSWVRKLVNDSMIMSFRNVGNALQPIFRANVESFKEEIEEHSLIEEALEFDITTALANRAKPKVDLSSKKWRNVIKRLRVVQLSTNLGGLKPSDQIWELTTRTEAQLRRLLVDNISAGKSSAETARKLRKFLEPGILTAAEKSEALPPGVYKSPFKNAWRMARTETNKAYTNASAAWAEDKSWVEGMKITLSTAHRRSDICDGWAGTTVTPKRFRELVPFHPHCMCYGTFIVKDEFLPDEEQVQAA